MKSLFLCAILCLALAIPASAISCMTDEAKCKETECCVEFGPFGRCRPLKGEGEKCEHNPLKNLIQKHVYMLQCPCEASLTCVEDDSGSSLRGHCQPA